MLKTIFSWFKKELKESKDSPIVKGDIWVSTNPNPFERTEIQILDNKEGYTLYRFLIIGTDKCTPTPYSTTDWLIREKYRRKEC